MSEKKDVSMELLECMAAIERRIEDLEQERDFYKKAYYELIDKMMEAGHDDSR